jgi:hypothetical protein
MVVKKFGGRSLPPSRQVALDGEAGYQADTLAPGLHFGYYHEKLSSITVRSRDGFAFNLDVAQIIHAGALDAPKVIQAVRPAAVSLKLIPVRLQARTCWMDRVSLTSP